MIVNIALKQRFDMLFSKKIVVPLNSPLALLVLLQHVERLILCGMAKTYLDISWKKQK